jgi:hypothetical protein
MSLYSTTTTAEIVVARSVYALVIEALNEALVFDDASLRDAILTVQREFAGYVASAEGELRERR